MRMRCTGRLLLLVVAAASCCGSAHAKGSAVHQPCPGQQNAFMLAQPGASSRYVFTWCGVGLPTVGITTFKSPVSPADFGVNCTRLAAGNVDDAVITPPGVMYHQSVSFASLLEFSGKTLEDGEFVRRLILDRLTFDAVNITDSGASLTSQDGLVTVMLRLHRGSGIGAENPRNFFTANSFSTGFVVKGFDFNSTGSRLAMEMVTTTLDRSAVNVERARFINDEYSPSIFRRTSLQSTDTQGVKEAHHAWKPVVYGNTTRESTNMTVTSVGTLRSVLNYEPAREYPHHIVTSSYDDGRVSHSIINMTFGENGDKVTAPKILVWESVMGPGKPYVPPMSTALLATNITSYGVTIFAFICGAIYLCIARVRRVKASLTV